MRAHVSLLALLLTSGLTRSAENPLQAFALANQAYRNAYSTHDAAGRREALIRAIDGYRDVLSSRPNGFAWYNLGNALFRIGRKGEAIHAYRRARVLLGNHPDLTANLEYVRSLVKDAPSPPEPHPVLKVLFFWYYAASMRGLEYAFGLFFVGFFACLGVALWRGGRQWVTLAAALGILLLAGTVGLALRYRAWSSPRVAVVLRQDSPALSGSQPLATCLFTLGEGAEVRIGRRRPGWMEAILPDGRRGWMAEEAFTPTPTVDNGSVRDPGRVKAP